MLFLCSKGFISWKSIQNLAHLTDETLLTTKASAKIYFTYEGTFSIFGHTQRQSNSKLNDTCEYNPCLCYVRCGIGYQARHV